MSGAAKAVRVRVPGSTSNCGSGFDSLGLALAVHNVVTVRPADGAAPVPAAPPDGRASGMAAEASAAFWRETGVRPAGFVYSIAGDVPPARGLGSSVTVLAGILAGLDALHGTALGPRRQVSIVSALEGHPDNASAGILGGFCVSRTDPDTGAWVDTMRFEVPPSIAFAAVSPAVEMLTKESRGALPASLPYFDAVRSVNGAAYLTAAFASGDFARLRNVSGDFIHEPYRLSRIPGGREAIDAGRAAGALTGWLSGSGSTVLCVCERAEGARVLSAMQAAFAAAGTACEGRILEADNAGLRVEEGPE